MSDSIPSDDTRAIPVQKLADPLPAVTSRAVGASQLGVFGRASTPRRSPLVDIHEADGGLVLEADVPGVSEKSVTVHLEHNVLHLIAAIDLALLPAFRLIQQEHPIADFERTFILSDDIDRTRITAELKHGALRIFLPRAQRANRRIDVKSE